MYVEAIKWATGLAAADVTPRSTQISLDAH